MLYYTTELCGIVHSYFNLTYTLLNHIQCLLKLPNFRYFKSLFPMNALIIYEKTTEEFTWKNHSKVRLQYYITIKE